MKWTLRWPSIAAMSLTALMAVGIGAGTARAQQVYRENDPQWGQDQRAGDPRWTEDDQRTDDPRWSNDRNGSDGREWSGDRGRNDRSRDRDWSRGKDWGRGDHSYGRGGCSRDHGRGGQSSGYCRRDHRSGYDGRGWSRLRDRERGWNRGGYGDGRRDWNGDNGWSRDRERGDWR